MGGGYRSRFGATCWNGCVFGVAWNESLHWRWMKGLCLWIYLQMDICCDSFIHAFSCLLFRIQVWSHLVHEMVWHSIKHRHTRVRVWAISLITWKKINKTADKLVWGLRACGGRAQGVRTSGNQLHWRQSEWKVILQTQCRPLAFMYLSRISIKGPL